MRSRESQKRKSAPPPRRARHVETRRINAIIPVLLVWFKETARDLPWRRTTDPYAIWVAEIMLQQTQIKTVLPYWTRWMRALPTIQALAAASPEKIHKLWEGLGYYTRVRNLHKAAKVVVARHNGTFPHQFEDILALPGIGRYTAGAICSIAFNQPKPILDGNVTRVLTRLFAVSGDPRGKKTNGRLWGLAEQLVLRASRCQSPIRDSQFMIHPHRRCSALNQSLMELGAVICTPKQPKCHRCPVAVRCLAFWEGAVEKLPALQNRVSPTSRRFVAFVAASRGRLLVRQRPPGVVNAHLWEFPNTESADDGANLQAMARHVLGTSPRAVEPLCTIRHSITRYRITLDAYRVCLRTPPAKRAGVWLTRAQLRPLAFTGAHKKILSKLNSTQRQRSSPLR